MERFQAEKQFQFRSYKFLSAKIHKPCSDPCNSCKPRFACEAVNAGTHEAECSCKSGWTGNGQLCLPQKKSTTTKAALSPTTLPPFNRFAAEFLPSLGQSNGGASEGMKKSGAMTSLTRRLEGIV